MSLIKLKIYTLCSDIEKYTDQQVMNKLSKWLKVNPDGNLIIQQMVKHKYKDEAIINIISKLDIDVSLFLTINSNIWMDCITNDRHKLLQYIVGHQNDIVIS
jgi:hypothetical protein